MSPQEIYLPRKLTQQLLHLAQSNPNHEICGLIGADQTGLARTCYPIHNLAETPENRFFLDSQAQIQAMKNMRNKQEYLFAIYHSHPHSPAIPSVYDIEQANYPEAINLIISLGTKGLLEIRAFKIIDKTVAELRLNLIEN